MHYTEDSYKATGGMLIHYKQWLPEEEKPKGIIQIVHGMAEHSERYDDFAKYLVEAGYGVYANDHRGHGKTAKSSQDLGFLSEKGGWQRVVEDIHQLTGLIKKNHVDLPIIIFGHSMGSLLARTYIQNYSSDISGLILSGTSGGQGILGQLGYLLSKLEILRLGKHGRSNLMNKLMFGGFNKGFMPARTPFDWLSRDEEQVEKYINDELCGGICTTTFYKDIIEGLKIANNIHEMEEVSRNLPILIFSGDKDPVGNNGKGVTAVYNSFLQLGFKEVTLKLYKDGRHEMINETNKYEVYTDILHWLDSTK